MSLATYNRTLATEKLHSAHTLNGGTFFKRQEKGAMVALSAIEMRLVQGGDGVSSPKGGWNYAVCEASAL